MLFLKAIKVCFLFKRQQLTLPATVRSYSRGLSRKCTFLTSPPLRSFLTRLDHDDSNLQDQEKLTPAAFNAAAMGSAKIS